MICLTLSVFIYAVLHIYRSNTSNYYVYYYYYYDETDDVVIKWLCTQTARFRARGCL